MKIKLVFNNQMKGFKSTIPFPLQIQENPVEIIGIPEKKPTFSFDVFLSQDITLELGSQIINVEKGLYSVTATGKQYNPEIHKKDSFTMVNIFVPLSGDYAGIVFLTASCLTPTKRMGQFDFSIKVVSVLSEEDQIENTEGKNNEDSNDLIKFL